MTTEPLAGSGVRRAFGKGPAVSLFTLGTMRALKDREQMVAVVRAAHAAGINHLETAPAYGPAEVFLGQSLDQLEQQGIAPEGGWLITSKLLPSLSFEQGQRALSACLERLGRPFLHGLAVHGLNRAEHLHWAIDGEGARLLERVEAHGVEAPVKATPLIREGERARVRGVWAQCTTMTHLPVHATVARLLAVGPTSCCACAPRTP